jgi:hypothetical protein
MERTMSKWNSIARLLLAVAFTGSAVAAAHASDAALDEVLANYRARSGDIDWAKLRAALAARKAQQSRTNLARTASVPRAVATAAVRPWLPEPRAVLLLRDAYSVQTFISSHEELSDNGASLTYTRNGIAESQTIAGKGALFYASGGWIAPTSVDPNVVRIGHYGFVPGVEWDIKSQRNLRGLSGSVSAMAAAEFLIRSPWISTSYLKANAVYTTDVATGGAQVFGGEFAWQPVIAEARIGTKTRLNKEWDLWLGFYPTLNVDYFHVGESGDFSNLITGRDYLWVGPKLHADLSFESGMLKPYSLFLRYYFLYDSLHRGAQNVNYVQLGGKAKLLEWKDAADATALADLSLLVRYTKGETLRTLDKNDELFAGLSLKIGNLPKPSQ